ncbi:YedE family putative selenium transporter [Campylobacter sp. MG1]|uniref:YedE family putative selenium transporter n=1 Tax=Campylobacter sp. MG1 TaxID=2976332 RepID=UPI00226C87E0|nr:YedE family putative selenium transporter [Campylobacter sp. MG1]
MKLALLPILAGACFGILAPVLVYFGNPANMGVCAACFTRDIAGALGLHNASIVKYIRPEIIGLVLGAFLSAFLAKEYRPRMGSSPIIRFFLGVFAMIGALVFLGCPWRMFLRLSAGDLSAIAGLFGFLAGIWVAVIFLKKGFSLGRNYISSNINGYIFILFALILLILLVLKTNTDFKFIDFSAKGPGSLHAPILISLVVGIFLGFLFQKSRFCSVGAIRDMIILKDSHLLQGLIALIVFAIITNLIFGFTKIGFNEQPIAHNDFIWNFLGMFLSGLAFTFAGGCPGRQLVLAGEGDSDAGIFVLGLLFGAAFAHNFALASSGAGIGENAPIAVILGIVFCIFIGIFARNKR